MEIKYYLEFCRSNDMNTDVGQSRTQVFNCATLSGASRIDGELLRIRSIDIGNIRGHGPWGYVSISGALGRFSQSRPASSCNSNTILFVCFWSEVSPLWLRVLAVGAYAARSRVCLSAAAIVEQPGLLYRHRITHVEPRGKALHGCVPGHGY